MRLQGSLGGASLFVSAGGADIFKRRCPIHARMSWIFETTNVGGRKSRVEWPSSDFQGRSCCPMVALALAFTPKPIAAVKPRRRRAKRCSDFPAALHRRMRHRRPPLVSLLVKRAKTQLAARILTSRSFVSTVSASATSSSATAPSHGAWTVFSLLRRRLRRARASS